MPADNPVLGGCVLSAVRAIGEPEPTASTRSVAEGMQGSLLTQRNSELTVGDGACTCFRAAWVDAASRRSLLVQGERRGSPARALATSANAGVVPSGGASAS